jgi:hypothetical protein
VAYAGEAIEVRTYGTDTSCHVDGFLLDDPSRAAVDARLVDDIDVPKIWEGGQRVCGPLTPSS